MSIHGLPGFLDDNSTWRKEWIPKFLQWANGQSVTDFGASDALAPIILLVVSAWIVVPLLWRLFRFVIKQIKRISIRLLGMINWISEAEATEICASSDYATLVDPFSDTQKERAVSVSNGITNWLRPNTALEPVHSPTPRDRTIKKLKLQKFLEDFEIGEDACKSTEDGKLYNEQKLLSELKKAAYRIAGI